MPLIPQLLLDDRLERIERLRARQEPTVDEKGRSCVHTELVPSGVVVLNDLSELTGVEALVERGGIETQVGCELLQVRLRERSLVLENLVVVFPELSLLVSTQRSLGGRCCLRMIGERIVAIDQPNFVTVGGFDLLKGRTDPCAEGSLKIRILDDGDLGVLRSSNALVAHHNDGHPRRLESDRNVGAGTQPLDERLPRSVLVAGHHELANLTTHLLERLAPEASAILLVKRLHVGFGNRRDLAP